MAENELSQNLGEIFDRQMYLSIFNKETSKVLYFLHKKSANEDRTAISDDDISKTTRLPVQTFYEVIESLKRDALIYRAPIDITTKKFAYRYALTPLGVSLSAASYDVLLPLAANGKIKGLSADSQETCKKIIQQLQEIAK